MATTPTTNPIPSESPRDLKFNAGKVDEFVNSANNSYTDRFGVQRFTIEGLKKIARDSISAFGYITLDSFEDGASITLPNQVLRYESTGEYYRWDGALPKIVPAGSTPQSSGGIALGAWVSVGDASLRSNLAENSGASLVGTSTGQDVNSRFENFKTVKDYQAVGDGASDDTTKINNAIADGVTYFPEGSYLISSATTLRNLSGSSGPGVVKLGSDTFPMGDISTQIVKLRVPSVFPTIQSALDWLERKNIFSGGGADILVSDGTYTITSSITCRIKRFANVTIRGNETNPENVILNVNNSNNTDGFYFGAGTGVAWLNGFTINGTFGWQSHGVWATECYGSGVRANDGAFVVLGPKIRINKMYYGVRAMYGANIIADGQPGGTGVQGGGVVVTESGDCGFHAYAATIRCNFAESYYASHDNEGLGFGFCAESGGFILCEYSKAAHNKVAGFYTLSKSSMWAHGCEADNNQYGCLTISGHLECNSLGNYQSNFFANTGAGICASNGGFIGANSALCNENANGVICKSGSVIDVTVVKANKNTFTGFLVQDGSTIAGGGATANQNNIGFDVQNNSRADIENAAANTNTTLGYRATNLSLIYAPGFGGTGNGTFSSPVQTSVSNNPGNRGSYVVDQAI